MIFEKKSQLAKAALEADEIIIQEQSRHEGSDEKPKGMIGERKWIFIPRIRCGHIHVVFQ